MVYAQPRIYAGDWDAQALLGFWDTNGSPNLGQTTTPSNNQQDKENLPSVNFDIPTSHKVKSKENKRKLGNWKKLWSMKVTVIPIIIGARGTVTKKLLRGLEDLEIRGRVETIQTTAVENLQQTLVWKRE